MFNKFTPSTFALIGLFLNFVGLLLLTSCGPAASLATNIAVTALTYAVEPDMQPEKNATNTAASTTSAGFQNSTLYGGSLDIVVCQNQMISNLARIEAKNRGLNCELILADASSDIGNSSNNSNDKFAFVPSRAENGFPKFAAIRCYSPDNSGYHYSLPYNEKECRAGSYRISEEDFQIVSGLNTAELKIVKPIQADSKSPTDTQNPSITIASTSSNDRRGIISGAVKDNTGVAELRVDGEVVPLKPDGSFEWQGFVPAGGKSVVIEAIDTAGLSSMRQVRLERGQQNRAAEPSFAELNPFRGKAAKKNRNALALIVGVSDYKRTSDPAIYADKDAQYFHDYAAVKLGVPDNNIFSLVNDKADKVEITKAVKNWLLRMSVKDKTDVYVFFAGHGLASSDGSNMFLLPYDGDPELLEDSAIDRKQLFADIQAISPRSVTVFLDSCYSGGTRAGGTLVASLRPITIRTKEQNIPDGFTVLSAAKGDQTSQSLEEAKHGLFSYFLMRGLEGDADANNDNQITAGELHSFVTDKVERQSGFKQTPDLQGDAQRVLVRFQ